ncbi:hypothetical protein, partial [Sphingomonas sp. Leaf198]|uniref:hypothetical protein n=1 Tax=Sphingomonas sp. Leaf198 TaxID=1736299 RepID=UPI001F20CFDB
QAHNLKVTGSNPVPATIFDDTPSPVAQAPGLSSFLASFLSRAPNYSTMHPYTGVGQIGFGAASSFAGRDRAVDALALTVTVAALASPTVARNGAPHLRTSPALQADAWAVWHRRLADFSSA